MYTQIRVTIYVHLHTYNNSFAPRNNKRRASLINYLSANYCNYMLPHPPEPSRLFSPLQRALNLGGKGFMPRFIFLCFTIIIEVIFITPYLVAPPMFCFSLSLSIFIRAVVEKKPSDLSSPLLFVAGSDNYYVAHRRSGISRYVQTSETKTMTSVGEPVDSRFLREFTKFFHRGRQEI